MNTILRSLFLLVIPALAALLCAGCESSIRPLKPLQRVDMWIPDDGSPAIQLTAPRPIPPARPAVARAAATPTASTQPDEIIPAEVPATQVATSEPATAPATQAAATQTAETQMAATQPAATEEATTREAEFPIPANLPPGKRVTKIIDPNQTERFIYKATYDNVWQQALNLTTNLGFTLDRRDYRLGVITTKALPSSQFLEFWKPQQVGVNSAFENTINNQRRIIRLTIGTVPGKPDFYQIGVQVLVERELNPSEFLVGPLFVEGSGFGRNAIALRSDYATMAAPLSKWITMGHDPKMEKKVLDQLFKRI